MIGTEYPSILCIQRAAVWCEAAQDDKGKLHSVSLASNAYRK